MPAWCDRTRWAVALDRTDIVGNVVISSGMRRLMSLAQSALQRMGETNSSAGLGRKSRDAGASRSPRGTAQGHFYPGDARGPVGIRYEPHDDDVADPGEVVWAWVPYEEDHARGKDRPALIIGRDGQWLLALPVTSKDHDRDAAQEEAAGRRWVDIGTGEWDARGRASEARIDRIVRLHPDRIRRTGGRLPRPVFDTVARAVRSQW